MLYFTENEIRVLKDFVKELANKDARKLSHDEASELMQLLVNEIYFKKGEKK